MNNPGIRALERRAIYHGGRLRRGGPLVISTVIVLLWHVCQMLPAQGEPIAMITDLTGRATEVRTGQATSILTEIHPGTEIRLEGGAWMVALYLASGVEYRFKGPAHMEFVPSGPRVHEGPQPERRSSPFVGRAALKSGGLTQAAFVMRSSRTVGSIKLLAFANTTTLDNRPELRWAAVNGASTYRVEVSDGTGRALIEASTEATVYRMPDATRLQDGGTYTWEVSTQTADGRRHIGAGDFTVADSALRQQAEALRPPTDAPISARVAFAVWLQGARLKDEARQYWERIAAERPSDPRLREMAVR